MRLRRAVSLVAFLALFASLLIQVPSVRGISATVVVSQVYGGGGNSGATLRNDFIELFNRGTTTVNITGWSVQYASTAGTSWQKTVLAGSIPPGGYYLIQQAQGAGGSVSLPTPDAAGTIPMAAGAGKVALLNNDTSIALGTACPSGANLVDFVGYGTGTNCFEGTGPTGTLSNTTAALRGDSGCNETDNNSADFAVGAPNPRNSASPVHLCGGTNPSGAGSATPSTVAQGGMTLLTVAVTPGQDPTSTGLAVKTDLTSIGGSATQSFFDDATNGDVTAGDNTFSFKATVDAATSEGAKSLPVTITDAESRTGNASISLNVVAPAPPVGMVISQVYGGGGNSGATLKNDFIELSNRGTAPIDITGWSVQYTSSAGTTWQVTSLSGMVQPGQYFLVQESAGAGGTTNLPPPNATGNIAMSATSGKVALVRNATALAGTCPSGALSDFVGYGSANCFEGTGPTAALTNTLAALRLREGCTDTDNNAADFVTGAPNPRNTASPFADCFAPTNPSGVGNANPNLLDPGQATLLTVKVTPGTNPTSTGLAVVGDLTSVGGGAAQTFFDDGTNGDTAAGDNTFSFSYTIPAGTTPGDKTIPVTITDTQPRTGNTTIELTIVANLKIHEIQGAGSTSPFEGFVARTEGIVTGKKSNGFFIQMPDAEVDSDPMTSEGIFVFTSAGSPLLASAVPGNHVRVLGTVQEFRGDPFSPPMTEIAGAPGLVVMVLNTGLPLPAPAALTAADTNPAGGVEQLERFEGMRVQVDSLTVVSPTDGFVSEPSATSTSNGLFYGVITGVPRPFREPGIDFLDPLPAGAPCCIPRFDINPERIRVDSDAIGGAALEVTSGAVVTNLVGPLDYGFRTWTILPDPLSPPVVTGNGSAVPVPAPGINEFTVASFNLERFFNDVNDPDLGEPVLSTEGFNRRLKKASLAIRNVMQMPDILGVVEMENLATLQALADQINSDAAAAGQPNPQYQPYLVEGNDVGGIDVGFLVKGARVVVIDVVQEGKDTTYTNPNNGQQETLNDRPPLVLRAEILAPPAPSFPVTVIVNHLRSLSTDDATDAIRVRAKRRAQAEFLANLVQQRQTANPDEKIILVGDFNAFHINDGQVDLIGTIRGVPTPADQVLVSSNDLVNPDLINLVGLAEEEQRYSFLFDGNAQVLDHILITGNLEQSFSRFHYARNNADFPESFRSDETRSERISDHDMPVAYFFLPPVPVLVDIKPGAFPNVINLGSNGTVPVAILSTAEFDAGQVNPATVELASAPVKLKGNGTPQASLEDVNGDGRRDLLLHVSTSALQLSSSDTQAVLTGMTYDGRRIRGVDTIRVVPQR